MEVGFLGRTGDVEREAQASGTKDQYQSVRERLRRLRCHVVVCGTEGEIQ